MRWVEMRKGKETDLKWLIEILNKFLFSDKMPIIVVHDCYLLYEQENIRPFQCQNWLQEIALIIIIFISPAIYRLANDTNHKSSAVTRYVNMEFHANYHHHHVDCLAKEWDCTSNWNKNSRIMHSLSLCFTSWHDEVRKKWISLSQEQSYTHETPSNNRWDFLCTQTRFPSLSFLPLRTCM